MLFRPTIITLLAALAAAAPSKRQSEPNLSLALTNTILAVTETFNASTDGTEVFVDSTVTFDYARLQCREICIPEFHCTLNDKSLSPAITLAPGNTGIAPGIQVGSIICGPWLPDRESEAQAAATADADAVEP